MSQPLRLNNPKILDFMEKRGIKNNISALENLYFERLQLIMKDLFGTDADARMVFWQEVFDHNYSVASPSSDQELVLAQVLDAQAIVHIWYAPNDTERVAELQRVTAKGHQAILSSCWYLCWC